MPSSTDEVRQFMDTVPPKWLASDILQFFIGKYTLFFLILSESGDSVGTGLPPKDNSYT